MGEGRGVRTLAVLSAAQAAGLAGGPLVVLVGGLLGARMAPVPALATVPVATMIVGLALGTVPAAAGVRRLGRSRTLTLGSFVATAGCLLSALAVHLDDFVLLCAGILLVGGNLACVQQYRFAAAEAAGPGREASAVSIVMAAGIIAGIMGPALATASRDWMGVPWTGSFLALAAVYASVGALLAVGLGASPSGRPRSRAAGRSNWRALLQPRFRVALAAGVSSYVVMVLVMTATPLAMQVHGGHGAQATARVIQGHAVGMYAPSLLTGILTTRLGARRVMLVGVTLMAGCVAVALSGTSVADYWTALVLLGAGWNLLFVAGTVELSRACAPGEGASVQGVNDFLVFGSEALAALGAGTVLQAGGWHGVNLVAGFILASLLAVLASQRERTPLPTETACQT